MSQCSVCNKVFTLNKNLYQHMRKKHNIAPQVPGKISCPLQCDEKFPTLKELRVHLESYHKSKLEKEEHSFPDFESFESWKKSYETSSGYAYVRRISEKFLRKGEAKTYFICHRSGVFRSESTGQRKPRKFGSNKIGTTCPSTIEASRSLSDGKVKITFWTTHFGHEAVVPKRLVPKRLRSRRSDLIKFPVCVVLPAAGIGERMGLDLPKQYISVHQKPIICYTVEAFLRLEYVKQIVVVASSGNFQLMLNTLAERCALEQDKLIVTEGASFRHQSIVSGLTYLKNSGDLEPEIIIIHDGVRPFVSEDIVSNVVLSAKEHGAAGVICPLVSTVIAVDDKGFLDSSLNRNKYKASEMPQAFKYSVICDAYSQCSEYDLEHGTECLDLIQKYTNVKAKLIPGDSNSWKVTHRKDIYAATGIIKENQIVGILNEGSSTDFLPFLKESLKKLFKEVIELKNLKDLSSIPNIVRIYKDKSLKNVIELKNIDYFKTKNQLTTVVHILFDGDQSITNFVDLQKQAKTISSAQIAENLLNYYVVSENDRTTGVSENVSKTVSSLLFESNPNLAGTIFLL